MPDENTEPTISTTTEAQVDPTTTTTTEAVVEPTTTTTTEVEPTTTTTTVAEPTTTTTTVEAEETQTLENGDQGDGFNPEAEIAAQAKTVEDAVEAGRNTEVAEPANDNVLREDAQSKDELLANARDDAARNHAAAQAV